jgi:hypothetical protein
MVFIHLECRNIFRGLRDFSGKFLGRGPKKFENPWSKQCNSHTNPQQQILQVSSKRWQQQLELKPIPRWAKQMQTCRECSCNSLGQKCPHSSKSRRSLKVTKEIILSILAECISPKLEINFYPNFKIQI